MGFEKNIATGDQRRFQIGYSECFKRKQEVYIIRSKGEVLLVVNNQRFPLESLNPDMKVGALLRQQLSNAPTHYYIRQI